MYWKFSFVFMCLAISFFDPAYSEWRGNFYTRKYVSYWGTRHPCIKRTWPGVCWSYGTQHYPVYGYQTLCSSGWRHNGDHNCNIIIDIPGSTTYSIEESSHAG
ncbi:uncharacterized protein LOC134693558 [Mytilus trossulus]|uniref:uncharacterized protein LOC134693558 n=1 Tax=Mytilus trossulus TaxID=6551 RepID=UPI0030047D2A